jgi:hypothetical protein
MSEFMCHYGDCEKTDTPIVLNNKKAAYRLRFCSMEHVALFALRSVLARNRLHTQEQIDDLVRTLDGAMRP